MPPPTGSALRRRKPAEPAQRGHVADDSPGVKARIDALSRRLRDAEKRAEEGATLRTENARLAAHLVMRGSDRPGLADPEVRDFLVERHAVAVAALGDKAPAFAAWFTAQLTKPSPLLAPYLALPEPVVVAPGAKTPPVPPRAPNPNAGASQDTPPGTRAYTDEEVAGMDDATWRQNRTAVEAQLVEAGKIRLLKKPATT